jgi:hypothetical protein
VQALVDEIVIRNVPASSSASISHKTGRPGGGLLTDDFADQLLHRGGSFFGEPAPIGGKPLLCFSFIMMAC